MPATRSRTRSITNGPSWTRPGTARPGVDRSQLRRTRRWRARSHGRKHAAARMQRRRPRRCPPGWTQHDGPLSRPVPRPGHLCLSGGGSAAALLEAHLHPGTRRGQPRRRHAEHVRVVVDREVPGEPDGLLFRPWPHDAPSGPAQGPAQHPQLPGNHGSGVEGPSFPGGEEHVGGVGGTEDLGLATPGQQHDGGQRGRDHHPPDGRASDRERDEGCCHCQRDQQAGERLGTPAPFPQRAGTSPEPVGTGPRLEDGAPVKGGPRSSDRPRQPALVEAGAVRRSRVRAAHLPATGSQAEMGA